MPAAPVTRTCMSTPVRYLHAVQFGEGHALLSVGVEILRRQPTLERRLACRPFAVEHRIIGGVAGAALDDHVLAEHALEHETVACRRAARRRVEGVAFPFVAAVAERLERVAGDEVLRLGAERRALQ